MVFTQDLDALQKCVVAKSRLHMNYVFGCVGQSNFLVNLKNKATRRSVDLIIKSALGAESHTSMVDTRLPGEKFAPGLRTSKKRRTGSETSHEAPVEATIERHAAQVFRESDGKALLLGVAGKTKSYSYDRNRTGLVLTETYNRHQNGVSEIELRMSRGCCCLRKRICPFQAHPICHVEAR